MRHQQLSQWQTGLLGSAIAVPFTLVSLGLPALAQSTESPDSAMEPTTDAATEPLANEPQAETPAIIPSVTTILPTDVAGVILMNTQPDQWQALSQYQMVQLFEESFGAAPSNPGSLPFVPYQVDYETAIAPWIGDYAATVVMPARPDTEATITENSMMIAPVVDADSIPAFIEAIKATRDESPTEMTYRGISILAWPETVLNVPEDEFEPFPSEPDAVPLPEPAPLPELPSDQSSLNFNPLSKAALLPLNAENLAPTGELADAANTAPAETTEQPVIEVEVDGEIIQIESGQSVFDLDLSDEAMPPIEGLEESEPSEAEPSEPDDTLPEAFPAVPEPESDDFPLDESILPTIPGLAIAVLPDFIALAASPDPIQQWLDNPVTHAFGVEAAIAPPAPANQILDPSTSAPQPPSSPDPLLSFSPAPISTETLAENSDFQRILTDSKFERSLIVGYGNLDQLSRFSGFGIEAPSLPPGAPFPLPPVPAPSELPIDSEASFFQALELAATAIDTVENFVTLEPEGIQFQSRVHFRLPQLSYALLDDVDQIYDQIPAPTYFLVSGQDLSKLWLTVSSLLEANPATAEYLNMARLGTQLATGLDLDEDIFRWLDGEYSLFLFPSRYSLLDDFLPNLDLGLGVMIQTRDRNSAETALAALSDLAASALQLEVTPSQINDQPITSLRIPFDGTVPASLDPSVFSYGWVNDNTLVMTLGESQMSLLNPAPLDPISTAYPFSAVNQRLPHPNYGYVFLNTGATLSLVYQLLPPEWKTAEFQAVQRFLGSIHSISGTTSSSEDYLQADFLFGLSPARPPSP